MAGVLTAYHTLRYTDSHSANGTGNGGVNGRAVVPKIVLLEARQLCSGATGRNGGHVKVKTDTLTGLKNEGQRNEMQAYVSRVAGDLKRVVDVEVSWPR